MSFQKNDTEQKVIAIVENTLKVTPGSVSRHSTFKDLGADSLDVAEMIMSYEESFGITIKDEEAEKIKSVGDVVDLVHELRTK